MDRMPRPILTGHATQDRVFTSAADSRVLRFFIPYICTCRIYALVLHLIEIAKRGIRMQGTGSAIRQLFYIS